MLAVGRRLAKESLQFFAQTIFIKAVTVVSSIVLARILGPSALGLWALVTSTSGWVWAIGELGLGDAVVALSAGKRSEGGDSARVEGSALRIAIVAAAIAASSYALLAPVFATDIYRVPDAVALFVLSAATLLPTSLSNILSSTLQAHRRIGELTLAGAAAGVVSAVALVFGAYVGGLLGAFEAAVIAGLVTVILYALYVVRIRRKGVRMLSGFDVTGTRQLLRLGSLAVAYSFLGLIGTWYTLTLLAQTVAVEEVGLYTVAWRVSAFVVFPASAVFGAFFPLAAESYQSAPLAFERSFRETLKYSLIIMFPFTLGFVFFAPEIISILYGSAYAPAAGLLSLLAAAGFLFAFTPWTSLLFYVSRSMHRGVVLAGLVLVIQLTVGLITIPRFGTIGLVVTTLSANALLVGLSPVFGWGKISWRALARSSLWALVLGALALSLGLASGILPFQYRVGGFIGMAVVFFLLLRRFVLDAADKRFLRGLVLSVVRRPRL